MYLMVCPGLHLSKQFHVTGISPANGPGSIGTANGGGERKGAEERREGKEGGSGGGEWGEEDRVSLHLHSLKALWAGGRTAGRRVWQERRRG